MSYGETLATNLRILRARANKSQAQIAQETGIEKAAISRYEQGERVPTLATVAKLADCYGVTLDQIAGRAAVLA